MCSWRVGRRMVGECQILELRITRNTNTCTALAPGTWHLAPAPPWHSPKILPLVRKFCCNMEFRMTQRTQHFLGKIPCWFEHPILVSFYQFSSKKKTNCSQNHVQLFGELQSWSIPANWPLHNPESANSIVHACIDTDTSRDHRLNTLGVAVSMQVMHGMD